MLPPVLRASISTIALERPQIVLFRCIALETLHGRFGPNSLTIKVRLSSHTSRISFLTLKRSIPSARTTVVVPPATRAARCAFISTPAAKPETMFIFSFERSVAESRAVAMPLSLASREPQVAQGRSNRRIVVGNQDSDRHATGQASLDGWRPAGRALDRKSTRLNSSH